MFPKIPVLWVPCCPARLFSEHGQQSFLGKSSDVIKKDIYHTIYEPTVDIPSRCWYVVISEKLPRITVFCDLLGIYCTITVFVSLSSLTIHLVHGKLGMVYLMFSPAIN
jgi:hypothetical protein